MWGPGLLCEPLEFCTWVFKVGFSQHSFPNPPVWHVDYASYLQEFFGKTEFPATPSVVVDLCSTSSQDAVPKKISYLYSQMEKRCCYLSPEAMDLVAIVM